MIVKLNMIGLHKSNILVEDLPKQSYYNPYQDILLIDWGEI